MAGGGRAERESGEPDEPAAAGAREWEGRIVGAWRQRERWERAGVIPIAATEEVRPTPVEAARQERAC